MPSPARRTLAAMLVALAGLASLTPAADAQPITYQGQLQESGAPLTGNVDLRFSLWTDAVAGGTQVGVSQTVLNVPVTNGLFSATLNTGGEFGSFPFDGVPKFLEITVRDPAGSGTYVTLAPRQPVGAAPTAESVKGMSRVSRRSDTANIAPGADTPYSFSSFRWQSFTAPSSSTLVAVALVLDRTFPATGFTSVSIRLGEGTTGAFLASLPTFSISQGGAREFTVSLPAPIKLTQGATYTVAVTGSSGNRWYADAANPYAGGVSSVDAGTDFSLRLVLDDPSTGGVSTTGPLAVLADRAAGDFTVGTYQGGTNGSAVRDYAKQAVLGAPYNAPPNAGNAVKLLISDYDNEAGSDVFPLYVEDENNTVDMYLRVHDSSRTAFIGPALGLGTAPTSSQLTVAGVASVLGTLKTDDIAAQTAGSPVTVTSDLHVGAGTGSPVLGVVGSSALRFVPSAGRNFIQSGTSLSTSAADLSFTSINNGVEWMRISAASGDIGIGRGSTGYRLDVYSDASDPNVGGFTSAADFGSVTALVSTAIGGRNYSLISSGPTGPGGAGALTIRDVSAGLDRLTITGTGNVGIGNSSPSQRLTVNGNILASGSITPSSRRFKDNVVPIPDALDRVCKMQGVRFDWKPEYAEGHPSVHDLGFIAEDVARQFPEVVFHDDKGNVVGMDYARLSAVAVQAIRQLREEKDREIADLKSRLDRLEAARPSAAAPTDGPGGR